MVSVCGEQPRAREDPTVEYASFDYHCRPGKHAVAASTRLIRPTRPEAVLLCIVLPVPIVYFFVDRSVLEQRQQVTIRIMALVIPIA